MPSESGRLNDSGQAMHHLRRVGPPATKPGVVDIMDFKKVTSIIGRNSAVVDFYLDSSDNIQHHLLSRQHARIVRIQDNQHKLFDDSLNGVFVNHVKICGTVILNEGDLVTFGHMAGQKIAVGIRVRQPDSEYQFIFERCNCPEPVDEPKTRKKFAVPRSPKGVRKRREQNVTRTITPEELQNVKVKSSLIQAEQTCSSSDVAVPCPSSNLQSVTSQSAAVLQTDVSECASKSSTEVSFTGGANSRYEKSESAVSDSSSANSAMSTNLANDGEEPGSRSELKQLDNIAQPVTDTQSSPSNNDSVPVRSEQISSDATDNIRQTSCVKDVSESSVSVCGQISCVERHQGDFAVDERNSLVSSTKNNSEMESDITHAKVVRGHIEQTAGVADNHSTDGQNIVSFHGHYVSFDIKSSSASSSSGERRQQNVPGEIAEVRDSLRVEDKEIEPETVIEGISESNKDDVDVLVPVDNVKGATCNVKEATPGVEDIEIEIETAIENNSESNKEDAPETIGEAAVHDENVKLDDNQDGASLHVHASENKHGDLPSEKGRLDTGTTAVLGEVSVRAEECTLQKVQPNEKNQLAVTDSHSQLEMPKDTNVKPKETLRDENLSLNDTFYVFVEEREKIQSEMDLCSERISEQEMDGSKVQEAEVGDGTATTVNKEFDKAGVESMLTHGDVGSVSDSTSTAPADNSSHKEFDVNTLGAVQHEELVILRDNTDTGGNATGCSAVEVLPVNISVSVSDQSATKTSDAKTNIDYFSSDTLNASEPRVTKDEIPEASEEPRVTTMTAVCKEDQLLSCDRQQATDSGQEMDMDTEDDELLLAYDVNEMETMSVEEKTEAASVVQPSVVHVCPETEISQDSFTTINEMEMSTVNIENLDEEALGQCKLINADMNGPNHNAAVSAPEVHQAAVIDIIRGERLPTANKEQVMLGIEENDKEESVNTSCSLLDQETITECTPGEKHTEISKEDCTSNNEILKEDDLHGYSKGVGHKGSESGEHFVKSQHQLAKLSNVDGQTELNRSPSTSVLMENDSNSSCHEQKNATNVENSSTEVCSTVSGSSGVCDKTTVQDMTKTFDSSHCESDVVCDALSVNETRFFDSKELDSSALSSELLAEKSAENQNCLEKTMDNFSSSIDMDKIEKSEVSYAFQFIEVDKNLDETESMNTNHDYSTLDRTRCEEGVSDKVKKVNSCEHLDDLSLDDVVEGGIIATVGVDGVPKLEDEESETEKVDKILKQGKDLQCDGSEDKAKSAETVCIDVLKKKNLNGDTFCKTVRSTFMLSDSVDFGLQEDIEETAESLENEVVIERNQQENADLSSGKEVAIEANHQKNAESSLEDEVVVIKINQQKEKVESSGNEVVVMATNQQEKVESSLDNDVVVVETNQQKEKEESSLDSDVVVMETNQQEKEESSLDNDVVVMETNQQEEKEESSLDSDVVLMETNQQEVKAESSSDNDIVVMETNQQEEKEESSSDNDVVVMETNQQEKKAESSSDNDIVVVETNQQEEKAESSLDNDVVVMETNRQEKKAESSSDNYVVVVETNRQEEKAESSLDNEVVVVETNQQEKKAESSSDNYVVVVETNRQEEKVESTSDNEVVVIETNQQEVKAESSLDNEVVVLETNQQEEKAESTSDNEVVVLETNQQEEKAESTSDNEVVVLETNQQEKAESTSDNEVVVLETNQQEEKAESTSDNEVVVLETNQQEEKAESTSDNEVVVLETNQQEEKAESTSDNEVVTVETNQQKDLEVHDVICLSEDCQYREEKPLDSESGTSQNSKVESSNSSTGLSQQFAELKQIMEMNQVIGACMDSILDRVELESNNESEGTSVSTCGKTFTDADGLLAQLPKNTFIEIEVSMQSAKLLGLIPNLGEKETSQVPNQDRSASNQDQYETLAQEAKIVAEFEKIEHLEGEKLGASKADVEKEFTIEDLVKLQSELHSDVNEVCSENGHIDEVLTAKNFSEQDDINEIEQNSGEINCSDHTPRNDEKRIKDENTFEAVQPDVCDSLSISTNKLETTVSSDDATNSSGQLKSEKNDSQREKFEIYIDNPETEQTSNRDNLETKMSNSSVANDKSETITKVKEGDLVSCKTEEPECLYAEEIMDTGHLNADEVPPLGEKVVTVVLSDDEDEAVDDDMLEVQTQQTDTADQFDPQHKDIIHDHDDTSLHKIYPNNILKNKACNSTQVTRPRIMEPCFVQIYEQNASQNEQQKLDSSYVGPRGYDHTLTVKDIAETSAVKTSSGSVHMERSISTDSENSGKVSLSNDIVYEWTVDPSKVAGSMESTNSLNTVSSSIDSMFQSTVESSAHVEQEDVDMMVMSSEVLSGEKGTTYSDGHYTSGEQEFKFETESESFTSIKEAKSQQARKIEFEKESSVVQGASKSQQARKIEFEKESSVVQGASKSQQARKIEFEKESSVVQGASKSQQARKIEFEKESSVVQGASKSQQARKIEFEKESSVVQGASKSQQARKIEFEKESSVVQGASKSQQARKIEFEKESSVVQGASKSQQARKIEFEKESSVVQGASKSQQARKIEFEKESSVVQGASKSNIDVVNQKVDVRVDESDISSEENVSSLCKISECEEKSLMVGKKRKFHMEDDTTTTFVKKPCNELDEKRAQRCTRLRKIVRQYFSIKNFYGREKRRSSGQVKKELVAGLVHHFFRNMKTDLQCRKDLDSESDKSKQTTNMSDWKKQDLQKQEGDVGVKKDCLGKTMSNILRSSCVHRNNVDINLSHIHPDSVTTSMDLGINHHKNEGESFGETSKNVTDASSNNIQSLHSESVEIFETIYREFRDTVEDDANSFSTMAGASSKGNNVADVKEKETEFLKNACISRKRQESDTSQGDNSGSKDTSTESGHFKGRMDPDNSSSTENKNDKKSSLAGMLSQLQFDNLVQNIERESQSVILKEGNVTVVIGIPSASLTQSVLNTSEKSFCDVETQASSIDIDMETGVIDLSSLPSSLEKDRTLGIEGSDSFSDIVNKDMDKVHIKMNLNQNAQDSYSNHSSHSTKDSEFSAMECTDDVSNNRMVDTDLSHSTQKHSEDALFETSSSERSHPSETSKDSCAKLSGKPILEDVTFSYSLSVDDGSQNVPTESASVNERRLSSECSRDSSRSTHSESLLGNIVLLYSDTVEGGRRASELTKENRYLDVEKDKENDQVMTKNSLEQRALLLRSLQGKGALNRNCECPVPDSEEETLNRNSECPIPDSSNDLVHSMSDSDDDDGEKVNTESSIEIISMSSSPEDSYVEFPSHRSHKSTCKSAKDLSSFEEEKGKYIINQGKKGKNPAGNLKRVTEDRKPYSPNSAEAKDTINETQTLQSVSIGDEGRKGAGKVLVGKNTSKILRTKSRSLRHWSSDSTNPDADDAIGNSDSTVQSTNIDEKTEEDQTDCMMENSDKTFTAELDEGHTDENSAVQSDSLMSRVHSRYNLRNNSPYYGKKTKDESSDEAQNYDDRKSQVRKTKAKLYEEKYGWGHEEIDSDSDSDDGKGRRKSALSAVVKPVEGTSSSDSSFDFSQRASQMKSKLPEFEDFQEGQTCVVKQETFQRFSDFEDIVTSDSSDSDLPEVEFLKYESPKKRLVQQVKCELLTPECKTEIRKSNFEEQGRTEKYPIQSLSKEASSKTKRRRKRSARKCSEVVKEKEKKKMQSPRPKMTHLDSDSDVMIITGDSESDTYDVTRSKRRTPIKKEIIYSEDEDAEFQSVKAVCSSQSGKVKDKRKQADPQNHKTRPKVRKEEGRSGKNKLQRRRRKRTSGQSTCKQEGKNRRPKTSDESDSSDDLYKLYFHDVRESSARGGYSVEDIFDSESKQSLKEKGHHDDGNSDMEEDDNDIMEDNTEDQNQMKEDISEEFSDQNECDDLVSETQTDHQDSNERHLGLLALDVMSPTSPSPSQAMSPVIPSFIKAAHSTVVDSSEAISDSATSHKEEACIDSDSTINYSDKHRNDDVQDNRGEAPPGTNTSFPSQSNVSCNDEHTNHENPEIDINESDSEIADNQTLVDSIECNSDRVKDTLDQSPHRVWDEAPEEDEKFEESNTTITKKVQDRVSASFDEEDDFVSPAIDFTALNSDDECDANIHSDGDSPVIPSTNIGSVETPKLGTSGAFNLDSDDDFEPIPSTSFKKRKLFEMSDSPAKKPCHEVVALDTEMSTQAVQEISNTQFEAAADQLTESQGQSPSKMSKARMLIEKLKAKRLKRKEKEKSPEREPSSGSSQETPGEMPNAGQTRRQIMRTDVNKDNAEDHIRRCRDILRNLRTSFSRSSKLTANPRVVQWKKDLQELEDKAVLPQTIIAVVGDTGAGKSSLMNALLDQLDILPTSGMRACTAVVVEVIENTTNDKYEADITFLSKEEWYKELKLLLKDLTDSEGKIKKGTPDPKSEAGVAFLKIKAVYGRIDTFDVLSRIHLVTRWLDKTRTISNSNPESFRNVINRYIETDDPGAGGQFWPIVKQVRIRLPNCDVCSSGAVLVDLPGVRDSNAARDKIARDYLKKCTVVWVVSSIHRAIDDKTAKDLLGENFRRQLLMDGQYGSIAFICTKADIIKPTEIIRGLKLQKDIESFEKKLEELELEQCKLEESVKDNRKCLRSMYKEGRQLQKELEEVQEVMAEGDVMDLESQEFNELQQEKEQKEKAVKENEEIIEKYEKETKEADSRCLQIDMDKSKIRKQLSAFCAMKRNEYSKLQIKKDFKAGLREMKRRADMNHTDFDEEDDDDLYNSDDDDEEIGSSADNLKVFCVSATEYQKMKNLLTNDGPPAVFSSEEETQIPALQEYVHQLTSVRRKHGVERLLQRLAQYVFDINHYLVEDGTESKSARRSMKNTIKLHSSGLMEKFDPVMQKLMSDLKDAFCGQINPKMYEGVAAANNAANTIVAKWGSKQNKENRSEGGLHFSTYRATIRRQGVFTSPSFGPVNFNEDLSSPMYTCLSIVWDKVFSGILWNHLVRCKIMLINTLKRFVDELCKELLALGVSDTRTSRVTQQILDSSTHKLSEMISFLKEYVTEQQREINRILTPIVQENLSQTYEKCTMESGIGMFMRIKEKMSQGVDCSRFIMFDEASRQLLTDLEDLQKHIISYVRRVCEEICGMVQTSFEPLYEAPESTKLLRKALLKDMEASSCSVRKLLTQANVTLPALTLPTATACTTATTCCASSTSGPVVMPGKGPQAYTTAYQGVQHIVTDTLGFPQNITLEEVKSTYVTDILKSIKEEPGSPSSITPVRAVHIKKEWNATDCGQGSVNKTVHSTSYNQDQYTHLGPNLTTRPFMAGQQKLPSTSSVPSEISMMRHTNVQHQPMKSILPQCITNTAKMTQPSSSYTVITQPHMSILPQGTRPVVSSKVGGNVVLQVPGSQNSALPSGGMRVVVPSASQISGNQDNAAYIVTNCGTIEQSNGHPVIVNVPPVAQTVEVRSSSPQQVMSGATGMALSGATGLAKQIRDGSALRNKVVKNAKNLKVPPSLKSPEKHLMSHGKASCSFSLSTSKGNDSPSLKLSKSSRLSLSQKRPSSPVQTLCNVTVKSEPADDCEPVCKRQRKVKYKGIVDLTMSSDED